MGLGQLLLPLRVESLGVLAVGYLTADGPGWPAIVRELPKTNFDVDVSDEAITQILSNVI